MTKLAVLFAGQGAQKTGMGKSLYDNNEAAKDIFDRAQIVAPGIQELCFFGEQAQLNQTINTQPCVYTMDVAAFAAFDKMGIKMDVAAGFSLGEYAALCAAGVISFEEGLSLVQKRARWMQEEAEKTGGGMVAVLGKTSAEVDEIIASLHTGGVLEAVNYNCPGQIVVAGDEKNMIALTEYCKLNRVKAIRLPVNGAFHSQAMTGVSKMILDAIEPMNFGEAGCPVYSNALARPYEKAEMKEVLAGQTSRPVYFEQIVLDMLQKGIDTFIEVGPGNALAGFVRRIDKNAAVYNIYDIESYNETKQAFKEE